jgi:hypothetical protein
MLAIVSDVRHSKRIRVSPMRKTSPDRRWCSLTRRPSTNVPPELLRSVSTASSLTRITWHCSMATCGSFTRRCTHVPADEEQLLFLELENTAAVPTGDYSKLVAHRKVLHEEIAKPMAATTSDGATSRATRSAGGL